MKLKMTLAVAALLTIGLSSAAAKANSLDFSLNETVQYVAQSGGTVTFDATVSAPASNTGDEWLNGDSFNIASPLTLDDTDFFTDFPLDLAPGGSFTGDLFTVTVAPGTPIATYLGSFTIEGGADDTASNNLGTVDFSVEVTPEPSSILLMLTGLVGMAMMLYRSRSKATVGGVDS